MQVYERLCFSSQWRWIILFLTFRKFSEPKCFRWGGSNPLEQNTRSHHWCVTFFSCTHPTVPSSPALICSPHSFRNDSTVIIQHFLVISVVIFLSNLTLLLHAFFLPFQREISHIFEICSYENSFFFHCFGVPGLIPPDELTFSSRKSMMDGFSCMRSLAALCIPHKQACMPGGGQYFVRRTEWLASVRLQTSAE